MSDESLERAWRTERARIVGSLARRFGDLDLAEDAVQEAFTSASQRWPLDGEPQRPGGWLHTTAYRKAIDVIRKRRPTTELDEDISTSQIAATTERSAIDDDLLGLLLACCHPALSSEARIALTLRHVCGLAIEEIAAAVVVTEATMAKRLVRARAKIKVAKIRFDVPDEQSIGDRIDDIRTVIYVVFTEGHLASRTGHTVRADLCEEAIWLARQIVSLRPDDDENAGLLALFLIQHARSATRVDAAGQFVRFDEQDRDGWDHAAIDEARGLLADPDIATLGPYRVEAAIAALHTTTEGPDWSRVADLYGVLARLAPSPIVEVNRAIAVGRADGPQAGLAIIEPVMNAGRLDSYPHAYAAHAELLERAGNTKAAIGAWRRGAEASGNDAQRLAMTTRAEHLESVAATARHDDHKRGAEVLLRSQDGARPLDG